MQRGTGGAVEIRLPKYGSERTIPMPEELAVILLARHAELDHLNDWMFSGAEENPPHQNTVGARWRATLKRADVSTGSDCTT